VEEPVAVEPSPKLHWYEYRGVPPLTVAVNSTACPDEGEDGL